jgi:hypothetical protein
MLVIAEHGHEAAIPEENVFVEGRVDKLGDKPALLSRFVEILER